ncbi:MAG: Gfo/Idh/MocA family oxidoreductase [Desulfobacterales bacterium]|nr:Gfo/Idh/MocA family oxidoreductase [Desulfobacterales bacterium]
MKIIFFGLGSIGQRHAQIIQEIFPQYELFAFRSFNGQLHNNLKIHEISREIDIKAINPNVAFITNPTYMHIQTAIKCAKNNLNLFIEKPLDCSNIKLDLLLDEVTQRNLTSYVAYVLRFHPVIGFLKNKCEIETITNVKVICKTNYSSWRPNQNQFKNYSAFQAKSGGILFDLSHEIDYIDYVFGKIIDITGYSEKKYDVTIDAHDHAVLKIKTEKINSISLLLDYCCLEPERTITVEYLNNNYLVADLINNTIKYSDNVKSITFSNEVDFIFKQQLQYFFQNIDNNQMMNNIVEASHLFNKIIPLTQLI